MIRRSLARVMVSRRRLECLVGECCWVDRHEDGDFEKVELAIAGLRYGVTRNFGVFEGEVLVLGLDVGRVAQCAVVAILIIARVELFVVELSLPVEILALPWMDAMSKMAEALTRAVGRHRRRCRRQRDRRLGRRRRLRSQACRRLARQQVQCLRNPRRRTARWRGRSWSRSRWTGLVAGELSSVQGGGREEMRGHGDAGGRGAESAGAQVREAQRQARLASCR